MKRRSFMKAAAVGLASAAIGGCASVLENAERSKKPNIDQNMAAKIITQ